MGGGTVTCVKGIGKGAQHTGWRRGWGPSLTVLWQFVRKSLIQCLVSLVAEVYEKHPHTAPLVFKVGQCGVKSSGDGSSVDQLTL